MVWQATDHTKMKPIKDPRVDDERRSKLMIRPRLSRTISTLSYPDRPLFDDTRAPSRQAKT